MPVLRERDGDAAGSHAELEERTAGHARETAEPVDRGVARGRVEVVERREPLVVSRGRRGAEPVLRRYVHRWGEVSATTAGAS